jgi:PAS domain S-box-containing protein
MKKNISILLVDDDEEDFLITEHLLLQSSTIDYNIEWCAHYTAAQAALKDKDFDIVLVDYLLGEKTGIDFISESRQEDIWVPTILLTGLGNYDTDLKAMHSGAADYLNKNNLTSPDLERSIRYALQEFQQQQMLRESERRFKQLAAELEKRVEERTEALNKSNQELQSNQSKLQLLYNLSKLDPQELALPQILKKTLKKISLYLNANCAAIQIPAESPLLTLLNSEHSLFYCQQDTGENDWICPRNERCKEYLLTHPYTEEGGLSTSTVEGSNTVGSNEQMNVWVQPVKHQDQLFFVMFFALPIQERADSGLQQLMAQTTSQISSMIQRYIALKTIQENEERLKQLMEAIPVGVLALDADGKPFYANRGAQELLKQERLINTQIENLFELSQIRREGSDEIYPSHESPIIKALAGIDSSVNDMELNRADDKVNLQVWGRSVRNAQGNILYAIATLLDISESKQTQTELILARQKAENANRAKSAFLANMSHEIRTPMNAILGFTQLLQMDPALGDEQQKKLKIIIQSGEHLLRLISDILEMSKIEAGHVTLEPETTDIYQILSELESIFVAKASEKNLDFMVSSAINIPRALKLDKQKLRQVLFNLLSNAFKFTPTGQIEVQVRAQAQEKQRYVLQFKIKDTGLGIAEEELPKVFQSFEQTNSGKQVQGGTGLGLAISQKFVQMMGGEIQVESRLNQGTCFSFSVNASLVDQPSLFEMPSTRVSDFDFSQLENPHALIVDDQLHNRAILRLMLEPYGFIITEAQNGKEALEILEKCKPSVVLLDMSMPVMDGLNCLRRIRKRPETKDLCVIMITANAFASDRQASLIAGASEFIPKPFKRGKVLETLEKHLISAKKQNQDRPLFLAPDKPEARPAVSAENAAERIPAGLLKHIFEAAICGDEEHLLQLIEKTKDYDQNLAQQLVIWTKNYHYEALITFLEAVQSLKS